MAAMSERHDCDDALASLYPYLDGELTAFRRWRVKTHLRKCNGCGAAYSFEERLKIVIKDRCQEDVPDEFIDRLRAVLRDEA